jgi:EAL domain-containing protein (putative c-di-GMP-specific phosphodiesterase class I)
LTAPSRIGASCRWRFADQAVGERSAVGCTGAGLYQLRSRRLAHRFGFPGLIIEVTEDEIIQDRAWVHEVATQLKLYNISISIDDFGSAYSSLSRLHDLPFSELKLDRSFVSGCSANPLKLGLCRTVVDLARHVGASVCAEGVEEPEDLRSLIELGCDTAQGFLFARPMPADEFAAMLERGEQVFRFEQLAKQTEGKRAMARRVRTRQRGK